jgi:hypothetical protein
MVIQFVWLSGTVGLVVAGIPIYMVIVGIGACRFVIFLFCLSPLWGHMTIFTSCSESDSFCQKWIVGGSVWKEWDRVPRERI